MMTSPKPHLKKLYTIVCRLSISYTPDREMILKAGHMAFHSSSRSSIRLASLLLVSFIPLSRRALRFLCLT